MSLRLILVSSLLAFASGCASIISGTTQDMTFHSNPEGATVEVDGRTLGKTPLTFPLKRGKYQSVSFQLDGYKKLTLPIDQRLEGWFWGNILIGGVLGSTTDEVSGAAHEYTPRQYMVSLTPLQASRLESETSKGARQKAREFIVMGYRGILTDLSRGDGDYLRSLFKALSIPASEEKAALKKLRALSEAYSDIPEFADHAIELYPPREPEPAPAVPAKTWDEVKDGPPEDRYGVLVSTGIESAQEYARSMSHAKKEELNDFILKVKSDASATSWKVRLHDDLTDRERAFIRWYLPKFSDYKPADF